MAATTNKRMWDWSGWDYLPGIAFTVLGILALVEAPLASVATGLYLGALLSVAGAFGVVGGLAGVGRRGALLAALLGLLNLVVGAVVLYNPVAGAISLTWLIGAWFLVGGTFELAMGFSMRNGRGWLILVGIIDLVLGTFVFMMSPAEALVFLGYLVGFGLLARGLWSVVFVGEVHHAGHALEEAIA